MFLCGMSLLKDTNKLYVSYSTLLSRYQPENVNTMLPVVAALKVSMASHLCDAVCTLHSARHIRLAVLVNLRSSKCSSAGTQLCVSVEQAELRLGTKLRALKFNATPPPASPVLDYDMLLIATIIHSILAVSWAALWGWEREAWGS